MMLEIFLLKHIRFHKLFVPCDPSYGPTACWLEQGHKGLCKTKEELYGGDEMDKSEAVRRSADAEEGCIRRARERGDEMFTLVGQDLSSPTVICEWIKQNIETAPPNKLKNALERALVMRETAHRKHAD